MMRTRPILSTIEEDGTERRRVEGIKKIVCGERNLPAPAFPFVRAAEK